jgi:cytochrome P450
LGSVVRRSRSSLLRGDAPTLAQLNELKMLDWVLKESLRLFPPIPVREPRLD